MSRHVPTYPDFESAQRASRIKGAVSWRPVRKEIIGAGMKLNRSVLVDIIMQVGHQPRYVYHSAPGIDIAKVHAKPTTKEIDSVRYWKAL